MIDDTGRSGRRSAAGMPVCRPQADTPAARSCCAHPDLPPARGSARQWPKRHRSPASFSGPAIARRKRRGKARRLALRRHKRRTPADGRRCRSAAVLV